MEIHFLIRGLAIGFSIAAPVGPIGVLCLRRTLTEGRVSGFVSGLGAATADAVYGAIAGFGLTFISIFLIHQQWWLRIIGGIFLSCLGVKTFMANPSVQGPSPKGSGLIRAYASTSFLTLTNPMTILSFAAIFAGLGIGSLGRDYLSAGVLVLGVFIGSMFWWFLLSSGVSLFRKKFNPLGLRWVNRISGLIILGFGLLAFLSLKK
ncbi:MAG: LysE family transporter [Thermodesulfobacteriota bacterium]|nr:LysE family transporter [Thermodesulfobacteriota bacterium]